MLKGDGNNKKRRLTQWEINLCSYILTVDTAALYNIWPVFESDSYDKGEMASQTVTK